MYATIQTPITDQMIVYVVIIIMMLWYGYNLCIKLHKRDGTRAENQALIFNIILTAISIIVLLWCEYVLITIWLI